MSSLSRPRNLCPSSRQELGRLQYLRLCCQGIWLEAHLVRQGSWIYGPWRIAHRWIFGLPRTASIFKSTVRCSYRRGKCYYYRSQQENKLNTILPSLLSSSTPKHTSSPALHTWPPGTVQDCPWCRSSPPSPHLWTYCSSPAIGLLEILPSLKTPTMWKPKISYKTNLILLSIS